MTFPSHITVLIQAALISTFAIGLSLGVGCVDGGDYECGSDYDCLNGMTCEYGECMPATSSSGGPGTPGGSGNSGGDTCDDGQTDCEGSDLLVCEESSWTSYDCADVCGYYGFASDGCSSDLCQCGDTLDDECSLGVDAFCVCAEAFGESCTDEDATEIYTACWQGEAEVIRCFAEHVTGNQVDCAAAFEDCS